METRICEECGNNFPVQGDSFEVSFDWASVELATGELHPFCSEEHMESWERKN